MPFDYKKEYKEFYLPPKKPVLVEIPPMQYLAVRGKGNPNAENGAYANAVGLLYGVAYTLKMSPKSGREIEGFFEYVVPPLEGFWWQEGVQGVDYARKDDFCWVMLLRLPDFVGEADFAWAKTAAEAKKKQDFSAVERLAYNEGLCVQCMHMGPYDDEPATVRAMAAYARENGCEIDITAARHHHEIYLNDPRKTDPAKLKTVVRHPVKRV